MVRRSFRFPYALALIAIAATPLNPTPAHAETRGSSTQALDAWQALPSAVHPAGRVEHSLVLDPPHDRALGTEHVASNDGAWSFAPQTNAPDISCGGAVPRWSVRDSRRDRMLMMMSDATTTLNALDLGTFVWSTLIPTGAPPSGWSAQAQIYDSTGDRVLCFGGNTSSGVTNDLWELQLSGAPKWVKVATTGTAPPPRQAAGAVVDTWRNRMVVGGGASGGVGMTDLWVFDLATSHWSQLSPTGTPAQINSSAFFDERSDRIVQFNYDYSISILSLGDSPAWSTVLPGGIAPSTLNLRYDRGHNRVVAITPAQLYGSFGYWSCDLDSFAWTPLHPGFGLPSVAKDSNVLMLCFDPSQNRLVEFGEIGHTGLGFCNATNDTYLWSFGDAFQGAPIISSFAPTQAPVGATVAITGRRFTDVFQVLFTGTRATFYVDNDTLLHAIVPAGASSGPISITRPGGNSDTATPFYVGPSIELLGPNLTTNPSFEVSSKGWGALGGSTIARVPGGYDGAFALSASGTGAFGVNDSPNTILTSPGAVMRYRYGAWVRSPATGVKVQLRVREYLGSVKSQEVTTYPVATTTSWQYLEVGVNSISAGSTLDFQVVSWGSTSLATFQVDDIEVRLVGGAPVLQAPLVVDAVPGTPVEVVVTASDFRGGPLTALTADLTSLPAGNDATFIADLAGARGVLRWTPRPEDGPAAYPVRFRAVNAFSSEVSTTIRVPGRASLVADGSFEAGIAGWRSVGGATFNRTPQARTGAYAMMVQARADTTLEYGINDSPNFILNTGITPGRRFEFSCWVRGDSTAGAALITVREYAGAAKVGVPTYSPSIALTPGWRRIVIERVAQAGTTLDFQITCKPTRRGTSFQIDDVAIYDVTAPVGAAAMAAADPLPALHFDRPTLQPNPFRGSARLAWSLARGGPVTLALYDVTGRKVRSLLAGAAFAPGTHQITLDARDDRGGRLAPGVFFYRLQSGDGEHTGRFVILD